MRAYSKLSLAVAIMTLASGAIAEGPTTEEVESVTFVMDSLTQVTTVSSTMRVWNDFFGKSYIKPLKEYEAYIGGSAYKQLRGNNAPKPGTDAWYKLIKDLKFANCLEQAIWAVQALESIQKHLKKDKGTDVFSKIEYARMVPPALSTRNVDHRCDHIFAAVTSKDGKYFNIIDAWMGSSKWLEIKRKSDKHIYQTIFAITTANSPYVQSDCEIQYLSKTMTDNKYDDNMEAEMKAAYLTFPDLK